MKGLMLLIAHIAVGFGVFCSFILLLALLGAIARHEVFWANNLGAFLLFAIPTAILGFILKLIDD